MNRWGLAVICFFFGVLGIHRFIVGKIGTGFLWLLTGGLFGIGALVDFIMLLFGTFTDSKGKYVKWYRYLLVSFWFNKENFK